ncbi:LOW QUALITY PROTEIN: hypothetical protein ACHAXA_005318 [Cyclostephanos tholiformis]|uniref:mRNA export factor GLE1 n=1 Tax=Cyclostephanos tholiformis TaxID=382380 RepID=A0ABD3RGF0_9STRA
MGTGGDGGTGGRDSLDDRGTNDRAWDALIRIDDARGTRGGVDDGHTTSLPLRSYNLDLRGTRLPPGALSRGPAAATTSSTVGGGGRVRGDDDDADVEDMRYGMDRIAKLVAAAGLVRGYDDCVNENDESTPTPRPSPPRSASRLLQLAYACERMQANVSREMMELESETETSYRESCRGFLLLLRAEDELANAASARMSDRRRLMMEEEGERERLDVVAREDARRIRSEEDARALAESDAMERKRIEEARSREERRKIAEEDMSKEAEEEAARSIEHVHRAIDLISRVEDVRCGLLAFESSSSVARRRLQFKKVVNGRINTLSHDVDKVMEVSNAVIDALDNASRDDDIAARGGGGGMVDPASTMGRRYLLDLLCSNLIVRVQADGFNGSRGDGFPLAATFASVSVRCPDVCPLLEGHLYRVCPTAVPALSLTREKDRGEDGNSGNGGDDNIIAPEDDLMESLGMIRDRDGEFESFDKFLHRTEGLISIMANIMSSLPSDHKLLGGHAGAMTWLRRFMDLLPPTPVSPLPLLTAPVLVAFLTGAGHMLANRYPVEFAPLLDVMKISVVSRLDESTVGVPSATRLRKVLDDVGFEGMRTDLPNGAMAGLYDDGKGERNVSGYNHVDAGPGDARTFSGMPSFTAFGQSHNPPSSAFAESSLVGGAKEGADASKISFSLSGWGDSPTGDSEHFGVSSTASTTPVTNKSSSWGSSSSSFASDGGGAGGSRGFGIAMAAAPSPSPLGCAIVVVWDNGGGAVTRRRYCTGNNAESIRESCSSVGIRGGGGGGACIIQRFCNGNSSESIWTPNPFGGGGGQSSGFGISSAATSSSFGTTAAPTPSPFGVVQAPAVGFGSTTFASTAGQQSSPFASGGFVGNPPSAPAPSPFGNNSGWQGPGTNTGGQGANNRQPCKFFASGKCNLGDRCKFSHEISGVGQGQMGGVGNPSPFGNPPGGNLSNTFGRGEGKQPCKFFASGQCRNGSSCRFSHEQPGGAGASGFGSGTTFGGGVFGQASNPSPFSGGGVSQFGLSSNINPFGGPRR